MLPLSSKIPLPPDIVMRGEREEGGRDVATGKEGRGSEWEGE